MNAFVGILGLFIGMMSPMTYATETQISGVTYPEPVLLPSNNREFTKQPFIVRAYRGLCISPDGSDWLFSESIGEGPLAGEQLLRYNLAQNRLYRYLLPEGYNYSQPNYSADGKWMVFTRAPRNDGTPADANEKFLQTDLMVMRPDGSNPKVYPIRGMLPRSPTFSPDGKKLAFVAPDYFDMGAKTRTKAGGFRIYEYTLSTRQLTAFAPDIEISSAGPNLQYQDQDTLILDGYVLGINGKVGPNRRVSANEVYQVQRGMSGPIQPMSFGETIERARLPSVATNGNIYFEASTVKSGIAFFEVRRNQILLWGLPYARPSNMKVSPDSRYMGFLVSSGGREKYYTERAYGLLDFKKGEYRAVSIPPIESATTIPVRLEP